MNSSPRLEDHLEQIARMEPRVSALVGWDEARARRNLERASPGPLSGWALGVKDIIDVAGQPTRCNADFVPAEAVSSNADVVDRFLDLGAFVLSKTVTTTFAYLDPGPTRNPWNLNHTPGGSSSGSAAAVACGMARVSIGSQTVASVNRPASFCGVVGFKPTYARLSTQGVFPFSPSVDTLGFFTLGVEDMQQVFSALEGEPVPAPPSKVRVGFVEDLFTNPPEDEMQDALEELYEKLAAAGFQGRRCCLPAMTAGAYANHTSLISAEVVTSHREFYARYGEAYPRKLRKLIMDGMRVSADELARIDSCRVRLRRAIDELFADFDVLVTPSAAGPAPVGIDTTGDPRFSLIWTHTGYPTVTLPLRLSQLGLPLGVQLAGPMLQGGALLAAASSIESVIDFDQLVS